MTADHHSTPQDDKLSSDIQRALESSLAEPASPDAAPLPDEMVDRILARSHEATLVPFPGHPPPSETGRPWHTTVAYTAIATTALAAALALTLFLLSSPTTPLPVSPTITATPQEPTLPSIPAPQPEPKIDPFEPVEIATGRTEKRRLPLPDGSVLFIRENSLATLTKLRHIDLKKGEIYLHVAKDPDGQPFEVITPDRRVTALGTRFAVAVEPSGSSVLVTQGKVKASGAPALLVAGQKLSATDATIAPAPRYDIGLAWTRDLVVAAGPAIIPSNEYAGGALVSANPDGPDHRFDLRKLHVDVHIEDGFARTSIDQTYFNHLNRRLEGTFYFPLPPGASISRLAMYVGENLMEGGMAERNHARQTFESIKHKMQDPALLEWMDGSTFRMRVFPLEGRQEKRIVISYTQRLETLAGATTYRFPVGHSQELIGKWSVAIRSVGAASQKWHSPSHDLTPSVEASDLLLSTSESNHRPGHDLVLQLQSAPSQTRVRSAELDNWTYLMLDHTPELPPAPRQTPRRDWIVLFETSGDRSPVLARSAIEVIRTIAQNVDHNDTISVVTAATHSTGSREVPAPAPHLIESLETEQLLGALDLAAAFKNVAGIASGLENPVILHLGSGTPVLGETDHAALVSILPPSAPYVGVGIGKSWNRNLMDAAADRSGGLSTNINPDQPVNWAAFQLLSKLNAPRLTQIEVTDDRNNSYLVAGQSLSLGQHASAITRFPSDAPLPKTIKFNGRRIPLPTPKSDAGYLPRIWAKLEIERLVATGREQNRERIVALSKASYVISPFTSLLVLENEEMYAQYDIDRGRKDHWALYPCPDKIEVVHDPLTRDKAPTKPDDTPFAALASWCPAGPSTIEPPLLTLYNALKIAYPSPSIIWGGRTNLDHGLPIIGNIPLLGHLFRSPTNIIPGNTVYGTNYGEVDFLGNDADGAFSSYKFVSPNLITSPVTSRDISILFGTRFDYDFIPIGLSRRPQVVEFEGFINYQPTPHFYFSTAADDKTRGGTTSSDFTKQYLRGSSRSRPAVQHPRPWHGLLSFTTALIPTPADALTIASSEGKLSGSVKPGHVDPAARALIDNARSSLPQAATLTTGTGQPIATFHHLSGNTLSFSHHTRSGLTEIVSFTPESLTHAYPELGLATLRSNSPFHRLQLFAQLPFLVPAPDDLALNASVRATDDSTVTVSCGDKIVLTLTFSANSQLTSLTRHVPRESKITFSADGTIGLPDGTSLKLTGTRPSPPPGQDGLFTLPVPSLGDSDDPLHHLGGHIFSDPGTVQVHIAEDYFSRDDRNIGLYTLLFDSLPNFPSTFDADGRVITFDPLLDHPSSPLAHFIASGRRLAAGDSLVPPATNSKPSFISRLAKLRFLDWALADETRYTDLDALFTTTLQAVDPRTAPDLTRLIIDLAQPLLQKLQPATRSQLASHAATLLKEAPYDLQVAKHQIALLAKDADLDRVQQAIAAVTTSLDDKAIASLFSVQLHAIAGAKADLSTHFDTLVATERADLSPAFWQQTAALAESHSRTIDAITFHQRAANAYYEFAKDDTADSNPASFYAPLLNAQTAAAKAMLQLQQSPDQSFIDAVVQNADRWRSLERQDPTHPCHVAAECLDALGQSETAWRYRTNELAHHPREKSSWLTFAQIASTSDRPKLADHAFTTAFALEETNATTLLKHAQFLVSQQRVAEARTLLERITTSTWGPDFRSTVTQAKNFLASAPFK